MGLSSVYHLNLRVNQEWLALPKYFKEVFPEARPMSSIAYFEKGLPEMDYHASLQNSLVVMFLLERKIWKAMRVPVKPMAAKT